MAGDRTSRSDTSDAGRTSPRKGDKDRRSPSKQRRMRSTESKAIHQVIAEVRRRVKAFKKDHLGGKSKFDFPACSKCLEEEILPGWNIPPENLKDYEEFLNLTIRKEIDEDVMGSDEYIDLISIAKRAQDFEILVPDAKRRLQNCLQKQVYKSCTSLREMVEGEVPFATSEYDSNISQYKSDIEAKTEELEETYAQYKATLQPFSEFVTQGDDHTAKINTVCNNLLEMCKMIETWANEDDKYPDKLEEEYETNKKKKKNLKESVQMLQTKKNENNEEIDKLRKSEAKAGEKYSTRRKDKEKLKFRKEELEQQKKKIMQKINKLRDRRDGLKEEREKSPMTPRESQDFLRRLEKIEWDIEQLEKERKTTDRQLKRVEKELKPVNDRTYEHKVDAVTHRHKREELQKENRRLDQEMSDIQERMAAVDASKDVLMKIREMKLSSEAYRKILRDKQKQQLSQSNGTQDLADACEYAAPSIGKDWPSVYLVLPFDPPRESEKIERDVDILDHIAARNDVTDDEQALRSLNKWRAFHRRGNVRELVIALRKAKKKRLAKDLENKFAVAV